MCSSVIFNKNFSMRTILCLLIINMWKESFSEVLNVASKNPRPPYFSKPEQMHPTENKPVGNVLHLKCPSSGNPTPNITWLKNGYPVSRALGTFVFRKWTLKMEDCTTTDSGNYTCVVCNIHSCINYTIKVNIMERYPFKPYVKEGYPKNLTVVVNDYAKLECPPVSDHEPYVKWIKSDHFATEEKGISGVVLKNNSDDSGIPEVLELQSVTQNDEGWYICVVSNSLGMGFAQAYLKVITDIEKLEAPQSTKISYLNFAIIFATIIISSLFSVAFATYLFYRFKRKMKRELRATVTTQVIFLSPKETQLFMEA